MLNSGSCRENGRLPDVLMPGRADVSLRRLARTGQGGADRQALKGAARDFASLFYSILIRQMQKTVQSDDEGSVVSQGARDFFTMFLPRAMAGQAEDPLARYMVEQLGRRYGDVVDEKV